MSFKKSMSLFLAIHLLVATSGLAFNVHYCGGEIASISSVFNLEEPCEMDSQQDQKSCCSSSFSDHEGCCSNETVQAEFDEMVVSHINFDFTFTALFSDFQVPTFVEFVGSKYSNELHYYCDSNAPPLYKLYSQLVFYA
ncbi:MAG: hypothetical protein Q8K02_00275 [Flavobacterium sp.]|nr:hypothetical protein [Flavobacterium sp.]